MGMGLGVCVCVCVCVCGYGGGVHDPSHEPEQPEPEPSFLNALGSGLPAARVAHRSLLGPAPFFPFATRTELSK
jgi:hypothetical protein